MMKQHSPLVPLDFSPSISIGEVEKLAALLSAVDFLKDGRHHDQAACLREAEQIIALRTMLRVGHAQIERRAGATVN